MQTPSISRQIGNLVLEPFYQVAASGALPGHWFRPCMPSSDHGTSAATPLHIEIVSHCWQYAPMLLYQLSSLVLHPPTRPRITMTVFHAIEDNDTARVLEFIARHELPSVRWNWRRLPPEQLFRRSIGRNQAAHESTADWVWMTDCDIIFHNGCLDALADTLPLHHAPLLYPQQERRTDMLATTDSLLAKANEWLNDSAPLQLLDIDPAAFNPHLLHCAKGEYQIVRGDVARAIGYCDGLSPYQTPATHWCKCREDRVFRWLLGSQGEPINVPSVYQIRHIQKGRYRSGSMGSRVRSRIRRWQEG